MSYQRVGFAVLLFVAIVLGSGCGVKRVKVVGKVTMDGKPIGSAEVFVAPVKKGQGATALTKQDGTFDLDTATGFRDGNGVWPGQYRMTVKRDDYPAPGSPDGPQYSVKGKASEEEMMREFGRLKAEQKKKPSPWEKIPKVYSNLDTSPIPVITVPTNGPLNIELNSKAGDK